MELDSHFRTSKNMYSKMWNIRRIRGRKEPTDTLHMKNVCMNTKRRSRTTVVSLLFIGVQMGTGGMQNLWTKKACRIQRWHRWKDGDFEILECLYDLVAVIATATTTTTTITVAVVWIDVIDAYNQAVLYFSQFCCWLFIFRISFCALPMKYDRHHRRRRSASPRITTIANGRFHTEFVVFLYRAPYTRLFP